MSFIEKSCNVSHIVSLDTAMQSMFDTKKLTTSYWFITEEMFISKSPCISGEVSSTNFLWRLVNSANWAKFMVSFWRV